MAVISPICKSLIPPSLSSRDKEAWPLAAVEIGNSDCVNSPSPNLEVEGGVRNGSLAAGGGGDLGGISNLVGRDLLRFRRVPFPPFPFRYFLEEDCSTQSVEEVLLLAHKVPLPPYFPLSSGLLQELSARLPALQALSCFSVVAKRKKEKLFGSCDCRRRERGGKKSLAACSQSGQALSGVGREGGRGGGEKIRWRRRKIGRGGGEGDFAPSPPPYSQCVRTESRCGDSCREVDRTELG